MQSAKVLIIYQELIGKFSWFHFKWSGKSMLLYNKFYQFENFEGLKIENLNSTKNYNNLYNILLLKMKGLFLENLYFII